MDCVFCGQKGFEGVVCPKCKKNVGFEAHNGYNEYRCKTDAPATTIGDLNLVDEPPLPTTKDGWNGVMRYYNASNPN